jgi:hypothetical protein
MEKGGEFPDQLRYSQFLKISHAVTADATTSTTATTTATYYCYYYY